MGYERFKILSVRGGQAGAGNDCGRSDHRSSPKAACSTDGVKESSRFDGLHLFESNDAAGKKTADNLNVAARDRTTEELIPRRGGRHQEFVRLVPSYQVRGFSRTLD